MKFRTKKPMTFERLMSRSFGKESTVFWSFSLSPRGLTVENVQQYLDQGGDVNAKTEDNKTLLHIAADNGDVDVVRLLLARGADINVIGYNGYTPLHLAIDSDCDTSGRDGRVATYLPVTKLLIESGADESIRDDGGEIPRDTAVAYGNKTTALYDALPRPQAKHA